MAGREPRGHGSFPGGSLACLLLAGALHVGPASAQSAGSRVQSHVPPVGPAVVVIGVVQSVVSLNTAPPAPLIPNGPYGLLTVRVERRVFGSASDAIEFGTYNVARQDVSGTYDVDSSNAGPHFRERDRALVVLYDARVETRYPQNAVTYWWCRHAMRLDFPPDRADQWISVDWPKPDASAASQSPSEYPFTLTPAHRGPPPNGDMLPLGDGFLGRRGSAPPPRPRAAVARSRLPSPAGGSTPAAVVPRRVNASGGPAHELLRVASDPVRESPRQHFRSRARSSLPRAALT